MQTLKITITVNKKCLSKLTYQLHVYSSGKICSDNEANYSVNQGCQSGFKNLGF